MIDYNAQLMQRFNETHENCRRNRRARQIHHTRRETRPIQVNQVQWNMELNEELIQQRRQQEEESHQYHLQQLAQQRSQQIQERYEEESQ